MKGCGSCCFGCHRLYPPSGFPDFSPPEPSWKCQLKLPLQSFATFGTANKKVLLGEKGDDGGGEEGGGGRIFLTGCCFLPSQTAGPGTPWSHQLNVHFQLASGDSSRAPALADMHWPLREVKEQISDFWWYGFTSAIRKRVRVGRNGEEL